MGSGRKTWPRTVQGVVNRLLNSMSQAHKEKAANTPEKDLCKFGHGWGTGIRNSFGLWSGNKELMRSCGASRPDDASMIIIEARGRIGISNQNGGMPS